MKTLINKRNPQIRITAPEIDVHEEEQMYIIPAGNYCIPMCIDDWTLVEEEENISFANRLKERLSKMSQEELDKAFEEMGGDNDESPTLEEYLKAAYHSPIETEPVDLEKEIEKWITPSNPSIDPKKGTISREVYIDCIIVTARHFYELGLKRKEK